MQTAAIPVQAYRVDEHDLVARAGICEQLFDARLSLEWCAVVQVIWQQYQNGRDDEVQVAGYSRPIAASKPSRKASNLGVQLATALASPAWRRAHQPAVSWLLQRKFTAPASPVDCVPWSGVTPEPGEG